jgi:hypothetical protein
MAADSDLSRSEREKPCCRLGDQYRSLSIDCYKNNALYGRCCCCYYYYYYGYYYNKTNKTVPLAVKAATDYKQQQNTTKQINSSTPTAIRKGGSWTKLPLPQF